MKTVQEMAILDALQNEIKKSLESHIGTTDPEAVKTNMSNVLDSFYKRELITPNFEIGRCGQLWSLWSFKEKLKWYFYNKTPIIRDLSEQIREGIDDYNESIVDPETHEYTDTPKEYPEYLTPSPKSIIISDIMVKLKQGIKFIAIDVTLGDK
jgi:hypothetical protein